MARHKIDTFISTITDTKSFETSEDTYFAQHNGQHLILMVADGAPQRIKTTGSMKALYRQHKNVSKPGQYAAHLARDTTAQQAITHPQVPVKDIPLIANQRLRDELESIYGEISVEAILEHEPTLTRLQDDPRLVRLILPACCITVARIDLERATLTYAHGGDTALFVLLQDGSTLQVTPDQMKQHDDIVNRERVRVVQEHHPQDDAEYRQLTADAQITNQNNGIYHNYVDKYGNIDTTVGVGVINGLPQLKEYLVTGTISLESVEQIVLTSDGMLWPRSFHETVDQAEERVNHMGHLIRQHGINGYLQRLHQDIANPDSPNYRQFGKVDDATAIHVQFRRQ